MSEIKEMLPFLIPVVILEFGLLIAAIRSILTHDSYKHGNRVLWLVVSIVGMNFVGPILYFLIGREES